MSMLKSFIRRHWAFVRGARSVTDMWPVRGDHRALDMDLPGNVRDARALAGDFWRVGDDMRHVMHESDLCATAGQTVIALENWLDHAHGSG